MYSTVNRIFHLLYFDLDFPTSGLTVTGLARVYCITFLHPFDPSKFFLYPSLPDILWVPASEVLTKVDADAAVAHMLLQVKRNHVCTTERLETRLHRLKMSAANNIISLLK
jgi:hypothetical protein